MTKLLALAKPSLLGNESLPSHCFGVRQGANLDALVALCQSGSAPVRLSVKEAPEESERRFWGEANLPTLRSGAKGRLEECAGCGVAQLTLPKSRLGSELYSRLMGIRKIRNQHASASLLWR